MQGLSQAASDQRRWHASWITAGLTTLAVAWITAGSGLTMVPLVAVVIVASVLALLLLWFLTPPKTHTLTKGVVSVLVIALAVCGAIWIYENDRPILTPKIGGTIGQNYNVQGFALDVEVNIQNSGMQSSYADHWELQLDINGKHYQGRQLIGEDFPKGALHLGEIRDQEFPVGKPVSGFLIFAFPELSHDDAVPYFACDSPSAKDVNITLTVWDSKLKKPFSQTQNLHEMSTEGCKPLPLQ